MSSTIYLKPGREKSVRRRHPWVFSGAVNRIEGRPRPGDTVEVRAADGGMLGRGAYSPQSQVRVRMWTYGEEEEVDRGFFERRLRRAVEGRRPTSTGEAVRLVYAESDGLPGVTVDRYGAYLVCQFLTAGAEAWRETIVEILDGLIRPEGIFERSDADVRKKEGLPLRSGVLAGHEPPPHIEIREDALRYLVDVRTGHKTGFYLDQQANRRIVKETAGACRVLNCFSYTGGFGLAALAGGAASVVQVESSASWLALGDRTAELNGFDPARYTSVQGDVFQVLRTYREEERRFDLIVLDPPKFAESAAHLERAARGYKDINRLAFTLLEPGGRLFTFSCSGRMETDLFQKIVADAALDAGVEAQIVGRLTQAADHPTLLSFPEGMYLKGFHVRIV